MNILFTTQSDSLHLFNELRKALTLQMPVGRTGFTIADSAAYGRWIAGHPEFEREGHVLLKEWDVTAMRQGKPDLDKLARYERRLGVEAGLFGAIVADRRLFMGPDCSYSQDYRRRFSDNELLMILQNGIEAVERLFDTLKPDVLVSFICVTMLEYLAFLVARARGVRILNLRATRIGDRVTIGSTLNDPAPEFAEAYTRLQAGASSPNAAAAREYIDKVRSQHARYEGVIAPSDRPALPVNTRKSALSAIAKAIGSGIEYRRSPARADNHVPDPTRALIFNALVNPWRARRVRRRLGPRYIGEAALQNARYLFYPLHTEPEVSLLLYGRPFVNQIEIIRMLAMSLPADMILVVKEHPWMVGKRSLSAYEKMLNIPRVHLASPKIEARQLVKSAEMIAVVTGSVALEAAILGKPVLTFGDCPFNLMPDNMVRRCDDIRRLPAILSELRHAAAFDEASLENYVAAAMDVSASVNLYSVLLAKKNVHREREGKYDEEICKLAKLVQEAMQRPAGLEAKGAVAW